MLFFGENGEKVHNVDDKIGCAVEQEVLHEGKEALGWHDVDCTLVNILSEQLDSL